MVRRVRFSVGAVRHWRETAADGTLLRCVEIDTRLPNPLPADHRPTEPDLEGQAVVASSAEELAGVRARYGDIGAWLYESVRGEPAPPPTELAAGAPGPSTDLAAGAPAPCDSAPCESAPSDSATGASASPGAAVGGPAAVESVSAEEFGRVWRTAVLHRNFAPQDTGPLPQGALVSGRVEALPWGVGATGLFVDIGVPVQAFVDVAHLPGEQSEWPTVGDSGRFEVVRVVFNWWEDTARLQIRLKPIAPFVRR
ncbi:hypothetical protein LTV02_25125 [Nocardia yamanashiensis]|uniref:hypothetical protein n=1 Tax=Nocardia yamanashiensis TaxID=209247 RepID=UPI001E4FCF09|nr:hypothetical protein [Nocardia yamanashiensis]UGT39346.1 hypothetical protein LTV02_25125 [Nocardia yamanashiensis]